MLLVLGSNKSGSDLDSRGKALVLGRLQERNSHVNMTTRTLGTATIFSNITTSKTGATRRKAKQYGRDASCQKHPRPPSVAN